MKRRSNIPGPQPLRVRGCTVIQWGFEGHGTGRQRDAVGLEARQRGHGRSNLAAIAGNPRLLSRICHQSTKAFAFMGKSIDRYIPQNITIWEELCSGNLMRWRAELRPDWRPKPDGFRRQRRSRADLCGRYRRKQGHRPGAQAPDFLFPMILHCRHGLGSPSSRTDQAAIGGRAAMRSRARFRRQICGEAPMRKDGRRGGL